MGCGILPTSKLTRSRPFSHTDLDRIVLASASPFSGLYDAATKRREERAAHMAKMKEGIEKLKAQRKANAEANAYMSTNATAAGHRLGPGASIREYAIVAGEAAAIGWTIKTLASFFEQHV